LIPIAFWTVVVAVMLITGRCLLLAALDRLVPKSQTKEDPIVAEARKHLSKVYDAKTQEYVPKDDYVVDSMAEGWFCRNPTCGVFNGDAKEFLLACRNCGSERPKSSTVRFRQ